MHHQFNIQQLYALPTLYLCVVFIWEQTATCATYSINWLVFITEMKSVYSAVRTGSLNKAVCALSLKCPLNTLLAVTTFLFHDGERPVTDSTQCPLLITYTTNPLSVGLLIDTAIYDSTRSNERPVLPNLRRKPGQCKVHQNSATQGRKWRHSIREVL